MIGLAYPWSAVRLARCELVGQLNQPAEDDSHEVEVRVRNGCLWPLWGLIIEGFVVNAANDLNHPSVNHHVPIIMTLNSHRLT